MASKQSGMMDALAATCIALLFIAPASFVLLFVTGSAAVPMFLTVSAFSLTGVYLVCAHAGYLARK